MFLFCYVISGTVKNGMLNFLGMDLLTILQLRFQLTRHLKNTDQLFPLYLLLSYRQDVIQFQIFMVLER